MGDLFTLIFEVVLELFIWRGANKFSKRKKERRKYEAENNLPKKVLIHPFLKFLSLAVLFLFFFFTIIKPLLFSKNGNKETTKKITKIKELLEKEKVDLGQYPSELAAIEHNNPSRKNITLDYWGNKFYYILTQDGLEYILISKGKDKILHTEDDIVK